MLETASDDVVYSCPLALFLFVESGDPQFTRSVWNPCLSPVREFTWALLATTLREFTWAVLVTTLLADFIQGALLGVCLPCALLFWIRTVFSSRLFVPLPPIGPLRLTSQTRSFEISNQPCHDFSSTLCFPRLLSLLSFPSFPPPASRFATVGNFIKHRRLDNLSPWAVPRQNQNAWLVSPCSLCLVSVVVHTFARRTFLPSSKALVSPPSLNTAPPHSIRHSPGRVLRIHLRRTNPRYLFYLYIGFKISNV